MEQLYLWLGFLQNLQDSVRREPILNRDYVFRAELLQVLAIQQPVEYIGLLAFYGQVQNDLIIY